jgi:hypothetical protein
MNLTPCASRPAIRRGQQANEWLFRVLAPAGFARDLALSLLRHTNAAALRCGHIDAAPGTLMLTGVHKLGHHWRIPRGHDHENHWGRVILNFHYRPTGWLIPGPPKQPADFTPLLEALKE